MDPFLLACATRPVRKGSQNKYNKIREDTSCDALPIENGKYLRSLDEFLSANRLSVIYRNSFEEKEEEEFEKKPKLAKRAGESKVAYRTPTSPKMTFYRNCKSIYDV